MELNKETMKKIKEIILFTAILIACFWKYDVVFSLLRFIFGVIFPFVLGGAIAFVLNVPMNFIERHLFPDEKKEKSKAVSKLARPVSLVLVILFVLSIIVLVMFVLIPQLGNTFASLGDSIQAFIPKVEQYLRELFRNNKEMLAVINDIEFDWNSIMKAMANFFKNASRCNILKHPYRIRRK